MGEARQLNWLLSSRSLDRRFNLAQFKDREFEDLLEQARAEQHLGRRQALFSQLESIVENRRPWLPLAYVAGHVATRSELRDVHCSFSYSGHVDLRDAYFKPKGKTE